MSSSGYIYAIGVEGTPFVKIGCTTHIENRLQALQIGQPFPLQLIAAVSVSEHMHFIEKQIHVFLAAERKRGEWFEVPMDRETLEAFVCRAVDSLADSRIKSSLLVNMALSTLGERVGLLRRRKKMTQGKLAEMVGVAKNTISRLEQGRIQDVQGNVIMALARAFGVSTDYLLGMDDQQESEWEPTATVLVGA